MIYVVMGVTGGSLDNLEWPVRAYRDIRLAEQHVTNAIEYANAIEVQHLKDNKKPLGTNPYDPRMQMDYTGTSYFIMEVEFDESTL